MATPLNAPMAGEIWHLSIEDLFQPVQEAPRLGGDGPFVINLSVSTAPISVPTKAFTHSPLEAHVYQIQVTEDGRTRYRLRLGPFASEDEADAILGEVRDTYPGALTATAGTSDLRVIASMQAKVAHRSAPKPADLVIERSVSQKIAAERTAPQAAIVGAERAAPQKTAPQKTAPPIAAVPQSVSSAKAEVSEVSIDIAWPTPELGVPPSVPLRAASPPAAIKSEPPPVAARAAPKPQWALPELDVPLPTIQKQALAPLAPVAKAAATSLPAPMPFELKIAPPFSIASIAPVLTEVVTPKRPPLKNTAQIPASIAAPILTETVAPRVKTPPPAPPAAAAPAAAAPAVTTLAAPAIAAVIATPVKLAPHPESAPAALSTAAATPVKLAPHPETAPPAKPAMAPPPKKALAPPPKQTMPPPPKPAAPKSAALTAAVKTAPVLTQSVAPARKSWPKFRAALRRPGANKLTSLQHVVVASAPAPAPREVKKLDEPLESLESTQTIRALTPMELEDDEASRWFVIQLALADHAFDPDAVPNLDIFSEYRLYSVAGLDQGRVVHALRLGFFREEIGAVAVASYLAAYWDKPTIKRVSLAERERFADQRVEARKDVGATGKHAVIEITDELVARRRRSTKSSAVKTSNRPIEH
ncbi:MAG: SPOR domain-containing protein [Steroidobacteraceae bacterium]